VKKLGQILNRLEESILVILLVVMLGVIFTATVGRFTKIHNNQVG